MESSDPSNKSTSAPTSWNILKLVGPGLVTACAVIGPGSILTSSKVGASDGHSKIWVVLLAAYYQSYLVRFKGWTKADLKTGMTDTRIGSAFLLLIRAC